MPYRLKLFLLLLQLIIPCFIIICAAQQSRQRVQQSFRVRPQDTEVVASRDALLRCEVNNQRGQAQWTQDGFAYGFDRSIPGFSRLSVVGDASAGVHNLRIVNVSLEDNGEFQCQVTPMLPSTAIRASATLTVLVPPSRIKMVDHTSGAKMTVKSGQSVTLECQAEDAKPAPKLEWFKGNQRITDGTRTDSEEDSSKNRLKNVKSRLTFTPTSRDNNMVVTCRTSHPAFSSGEELSASVSLDVQYKPGNPELLGYIDGEVARAGDNKTLTCRSKGGNPLPEVFWYKNGQQIDTDFVKHRSYTINEYKFAIQPSDNNAKYECHVYNVMTSQPKKGEFRMKVNFSPESVKISGPDEVDVGDLISLSCAAKNSNPAADVSLLINGHPPPGSSSVRSKTPEGGFTTMTNLTGFEVGPLDTDLTVNCYAANQPLGTTKVDTKIITVLRPPNPPIIFGYQEGAILRKGDRRRLTCRSSGGNPPPDLKWFKGSKLIKTKTMKESGSAVSHLNILLQRSDNGAEYRCEAQNSATPSPLFNSTTLTVTYPPSAVKVSVTPSAPRSGDTATLSCITTPAFPRANVTWWREGFQMAGSYGPDSSGLYSGTISSYSVNVSITPELDKEIFTCQADNGFGSTTHDALILDVQYLPVITLAKTKLEVKEGEAIYIEGSASGNPEPTEYTWKLGTDSVGTGPTLNLTNASKEMAGIYILEVTSDIGVSRSNVTVIIKYAPIITKVTHRREVNPGSRVSLECIYEGGSNSKVEWKREDFDMARTETVSYEGRSVLYISNVTSSDSGFYECHVKNEIGKTMSPNASLVVNQKPVVDQSPQFKKAAAELGSTGTLTCRVTASPEVHFTWFTKDHEPIDSDVHPRYEPLPGQLVDNLNSYESSLLVKNVTLKDHGFFLCQARNSFGFVTTHVHLEGTARPDSPSDLKILNVTHDSVLLTWVPGFNGGLPQTFRVRYKLIDSKNYLYTDVYPGNSTEFWVSNLGLGESYEFSLVALNRKGESDYTEESVRGKTLSDSPALGSTPSGFSPKSGRIPGLIIVIITLVGAAMLVLNIALVACFIRRRTRKRMAASSDKTSSKSTTIEMYAPSSYTGTVTGETLSSISEKSRESYTNEDSADDYEVDGTRVNAASTYLIENLEPPPQYASRPPSHAMVPQGTVMEGHGDENTHRNHYNVSNDRAPGYATLGRRVLSTSPSDPYSLGHNATRYSTYRPGTSSHLNHPHFNQTSNHPHYNGSLQRNPALKLHFPTDYIRNGSVGNPSTSPITTELPFSDSHEHTSPTRTNAPVLSTFGTEVPHASRGISMPIEQRGHLV